MNPAKEKFKELLKFEREDNSWDYKEKIELSTKSDKYNLIKDFLAFANYGGGYILIGIEKDNKTLKSVSNYLDPADIGNVLERNLGFNIDFEISYFEIQVKSQTFEVGLIHIYPSKYILTCPKDYHGENNKVILKENDVLTRRNTKSTKANSEDFRTISKRLENIKNSDTEIDDKKLPIFEDSFQEVTNLWNAIENKFTFNAEQVAIKIRGLVAHSKHNKKDFAKLIGIDSESFELILKGEKIPSLELLLRICSQNNIDISFFFSPSYGLMSPPWKDDLTRYSIIKNIKPLSDLTKIKDVDNFLGKVVYETAKNIFIFYTLIFHKKFETNWLYDKTFEKISKIYNDFPKDLKKDFFGELSHQHYKLLEQVIENNQERKFTDYEKIIVIWFGLRDEYLARIFTEAIKEIKVNQQGKPEIKFHFWEEIINKKIRGRTYDSKNIRLVFSGTKIQI